MPIVLDISQHSMPALDDCGVDDAADDADDDCSTSSDGTYPRTIRPQVARGLSFENDKELIQVLKDMQEPAKQTDSASSTSIENRTRGPPKRTSSFEMDREILQAVEKAATTDAAANNVAAEAQEDGATIKDVHGHPAAHMIKSVAKQERDVKKEKKKKKDSKHKRRKSKEDSATPDATAEDRKKHRKSKSKKDSASKPHKANKEAKKEKKPRNEEDGRERKLKLSEKKLKKEKSETKLKKEQSDRKLKKIS